MAAILLLADLAFFTKKEININCGRKPDNKGASIIVLNWNGKDLLGQCVPSVLDAVNYDGGDHEVIVVDNGSTDGSKEFIQEYFPAVKLVALEKNMRFAGGNNAGVAASSNDIVMFLNNDMIVEKDFLRPLLDDFKDGDTFSVTSQLETKEKLETGKTHGKVTWGIIDVWHEQIPSKGFKDTVPVLYGGGGSSAIDKAKFLSLGGFDTLYDPFYWEDTDLSYRAWKRGWKSLFEPKSRVYHKHRGTSRPTFGDRYINKAIERNRYLFVWRNIIDVSWITSHFFHLLPVLFFRVVRDKNTDCLYSFIWALRQFPKAFVKRFYGRKYYKLSDREVFEITSSRSSYL